MPEQFPVIPTPVEEVPAATLKARLDGGEQLTLLDTRREADFEEWHITHPNLTVVNVPFTAFLDESGDQPAPSVPEGVPEGPLVTCCAKGISSLYVAKYLAREGWEVLGLEDGMEGWARLTEMRPVKAGRSIDVIQFHRPSSGCLTYLLVADGEAAVVDPLQAFAGEYVRETRERDATLRYAVDTHVHADHASGVRDVAELSDAEVVMPDGARDRGLEFDARLVDDGEALPLGGTAIDVVALPGHTTEMTGYRFGDVFVTGDTVFLDSVARPDLEDEARAREAAGRLWETLSLFEALPDETVIAPAHVSSTTTPAGDATFTATLGSLRKGLAAFDRDREAFVERVASDLPARPNNYERLIAINLGRTSASREELFELELGPNNCAVDG